MKKGLCILGILSILLIGSTVTFADPVGRPNTEESASIISPISIVLMYSGK